jgi:ferredoxin-nitrite reductase
MTHEPASGLLGESFTEEQKQYLQGFVAGCDLARAARGLVPLAAMLRGGRGAPSAAAGQGGASATQTSAPAGQGGAAATPATAAARAASAAATSGSTLLAPRESLAADAQQRVVLSGGKLSPEELAKREKDPLGMWDQMRANAARGAFPQGADVFRYKFHGLFYVAPAQNAFMCRLRFAGGVTNAHQLRGVADLAERYAGGYADVTTRANLQLREIPPQHALDVLTGLIDLGIVNRGAGADNIRNITGSPTAGFDPQELIDVRPLCREMHHYILQHRELYGLPRKFNIAFDGGGTISALAETNDLGFVAVRLVPGHDMPPGTYFRMELGGITGHGDFARDAGVLLRPEECVPVAAAAVRAFIEHGDRTDRRRARLKYVLQRLGIDGFLAETQKHLDFALRRVALQDCQPRGPVNRLGHIGVHPQRQPGRYYVGVVLPVGRITVEQLRCVADLAARYGTGDVRLTVWQNLLIPHIAQADVPRVQQALEDAGLHWSATNIRAGLVACTGNGGCKFAASNTKGHALQIAAHLEPRVTLDQPLNIHLTGCHHSCAQHYIGDVGLLATKVAMGDDLVEGYHVYVGGGCGMQQGIARELCRNVPASEVPALLECLLLHYHAHRRDASETFVEFARRQSIESLREPLAMHLADVGAGQGG